LASGPSGNQRDTILSIDEALNNSSLISGGLKTYLTNLMNTKFLTILAVCFMVRAEAQSILFDFENASRFSPLPVSLTVGGLTAQFSGTGQGFSIQAANTMGFTPVGFSGNCIYPASINLADLIVAFSAPLTDFSILYAPQELACDSSATMRVTAYLHDAMVGTTITNAQAGTWPTETLRFNSTQGFNKVVVHYDKAPVTGGDYGPIFMADNMAVTLAQPLVVLSSGERLGNGAFQFTFSTTPGTSCTVLGSTNVALPVSSWDVLGSASEISAGHYQFTEPQTTNNAQYFYRVRWP
jgi:hypothetical protein